MSKADKGGSYWIARSAIRAAFAKVALTEATWWFDLDNAVRSSSDWYDTCVNRIARLQRGGGRGGQHIDLDSDCSTTTQEEAE